MKFIPAGLSAIGRLDTNDRSFAQIRRARRPATSTTVRRLRSLAKRLCRLMSSKMGCCTACLLEAQVIATPVGEMFAGINIQITGDWSRSERPNSLGPTWCHLAIAALMRHRYWLSWRTQAMCQSLWRYERLYARHTLTTFRTSVAVHDRNYLLHHCGVAA